MVKRKTYFLFILLTMLLGCRGLRQGIFTHHSPHDEYRAKLQKAGLDKTKVGRQWMETADSVIFHPVSVNVPSTEAVVFDFDGFTAVAYRLSLSEGRDIRIVVEPEIKDTAEIFIDLFRIDNQKFKRAGFASKDSLRLIYQVKKGGNYVVRIQPELMVQGLFNIYIFTGTTLDFPIEGKNFKSISSFYGDPREGGRRRHEGIDIFAERGTPAVAVSPGKVRRTGFNRLGGKVVWVADANSGYSYYYAHLDTQLVLPGSKVDAGDVLGLIGNTGNARTTSPHLHFGIYKFGRGAVNPYPFFHRTRMKAVDPETINQYAGKWGETTAVRTNFRNNPGIDSGILRSLPRKTPLLVKGITGHWLRVELPEGETGFIHQSLVQISAKKLQDYSVAAQKIVRSKPVESSHATGIVEKNDKIAVYNRYNSYRLIQANGNFGWIKEGSLKD